MQPHPTCLRFQGSLLQVAWAGTATLHAGTYFFPLFVMNAQHENRILKSIELPPLAVDLFERSGELLVVIWDGESETPEKPSLVVCPCHARELAHALEKVAKAARRSFWSDALRKLVFPTTHCDERTDTSSPGDCDQ